MSIKTQRKIHLFLFWPAIGAMLVYILSALSHPLMAWTGPQVQKMFPPSMNISDQHIHAISSISQLHLNGLKAGISKLVPFKDEVLLQVTTDTQSVRQYFSTDNFQPINNHDEKQAIWLAEYFYGEALSLKNITLQTEFSTVYPAVNRLLPIYLLEFDTDDNLQMYIHTETQTLAGISNDWKRSLSFIFQNFHRFDWLNGVGPVRVFLVALLTSLILVMAITGLYLLIKLKKRKGKVAKIKHQRRNQHRLVAWITAIPLVMFCTSGLFHLFMKHFNPTINDIQLIENIEFSQYQNPISLPETITNNKINHVSLFDGMYRISVSPVAPQANSREARFSGRSKEQNAIYLDAKDGRVLNKQSRVMAMEKAAQYLDSDINQIENMKLITRFGPTYDFRNKRLPVWQVDFNNPNKDRLFIDPVNNILIDQNTQSNRLEGYSFSFLHKWNMLIPLAGRQGRDIIISLVLGCGLILTLLGFLIRKRKLSAIAQPAHLSEPALELDINVNNDKAA